MTIPPSHNTVSPEPPPVSPAIPPEVRAYLGKPALRPGEDPGAYEELMIQVSYALKPKDAIGWLWVRDVVDCIWRMNALKRFRNALERDGYHEAIEDALVEWHKLQGKTAAEARSTAADEAAGFVANWERASILSRLEAIGITQETLLARGMMLRLAEIERVDRIVAQERAYRDAIVREKDRRRETLARLQRMVDDVENIEVITP